MTRGFQLSLNKSRSKSVVYLYPQIYLKGKINSFPAFMVATGKHICKYILKNLDSEKTWNILKRGYILN